MSIKARLHRVERAVGVGELCLNCKRQLILYGDLIARTKPEDVFSRPCRNCGFPSYEVLDGYSNLERGLLREIILNDRQERKTLEKRQRFFALALYVYILPRSREIRGIGEAEEERLRAIEKQPTNVRQQVKVLDEWEAQQEAAKTARAHKRTEEEDEQRLARRAVSAQTMAVIERVKAEKINDEDLHYLKIMAGLEVLIFGATLPETKEKVEAREAALLAEREERKRQEREQEEERERRQRELREQRERERLEREKERAERERAAAPAPPQGPQFYAPDKPPLYKKPLTSQPPPDDGRDPHYHMKMAHYRLTGTWPPDDWLR